MMNNGGIMPFASQEAVKKSFSKITISLASPDMILSRSHGEVTSLKRSITDRSGRKKTVCFARKFSACPRLECHCGKYKRIRYKGINAIAAALK